MSDQSKTQHSRRAQNVDSDFNPPKTLSPSVPIIVKQRTASEPPEVPQELLGMDDEDCPRLASVASVARARRMSGADDRHNHSPHNSRRHGGGPDKHSLLLSMNPEIEVLKVPPKSSSKNGEMRRSESECSITRAKSAGAGIGSFYVPISPSTKFDVGIADTTGRRDEMEDSWALCGNFGGSAENNLYLLLDGHCGKAAADLAARKLPEFVHNELKNGKEPEEALRSAFHKTHELALEQVPQCGTTATALLFLGDRSWVAHVGDSRALTVAEDGATKRLTVDHRASNKAEAEAVRARGAFVLSLGGGGLRVNGMISVTRALGDKSLSSALTCEPDVNEFVIPDGGCIILACDGLWDCVSDEDVARVATNKALNPREVAENLRDMAYKKGSFDNISVVVIRSVR